MMSKDNLKGTENVAYEKDGDEGVIIGVLSNGEVAHFPENDQVPPKGLTGCKSTTVMLPANDVVDPFAIVDEYEPTGPPWSELDTTAKIKRVTVTTTRIILLITMLYLFICSLGFLGNAFQLLGGKAAGQAFSSDAILSNPLAGLMIGMLATVLLQSSSTTTSIVVAMVASGIMQVKPAVPIVMGANIGTSVTNTLVAIGQIGDKDQFRRAFAGATVHDMFNLLNVAVLLPIECATHYLYHLTDALITAMHLKDQSGSSKHLEKKEFLSKITKPFTNLFVQLDEKVILAISTGDKRYMDTSLIKFWCDKGVTAWKANNQTFANGSSLVLNQSYVIHHQPCKFLLHGTGLSDHAIGVIMLVIALVILCSCLVCIVKLLHSMLKGQIAGVIRRTFNADFPKPFGFLTGYVAILVGAGMTMLVQSSSIFTSALTPLVGLGLVSVERIYPLTLGANIGTTATGILAAMASSGEKLAPALQIALCHLFFNISGILIWYPIPKLRGIPTGLARGLGNITADYRWFAIAYLIFCFFMFPALIFALSLAGWKVCTGLAAPIVLIIIFVVIVNILQSRKPDALPVKLRTWKWLPSGFRSLEPYDRILTKVYSVSFKNKTKSFIGTEEKETKETTTV